MKTLSLPAMSVALLLLSFPVFAQPVADIYSGYQEPIDSAYVGDAKESLTITITNTGTSPLTYDIASTHPAFWVDVCSHTLLPGESGCADVAFHPTQVGTISAIITLSTNDPANPQFVYPITGKGIVPPLAETSITETLAVNTQTVRQVVLYNVANQMMKFELYAGQPGTYKSDFITFSNGTEVQEYVLGAGQSTLVDLTFDATNQTAGTYDNYISIYANFFESDKFGAYSIPVSITIVDSIASVPPNITVQWEDSIAFGDVYISNSPLFWPDWKYVGNDGGEPLVISAVTVSNPVFQSIIDTGWMGYPVTIQPGEELILFSSFHPVEIGPAETDIFIHTNDPDQPVYTLHATGNGIKSPNDLIVTPIQIRDTIAWNTSPQYQLLFRNDGVEPVSFNYEHWPPDFASVSPASGTLQPGDSLELTITTMASRITPGLNLSYLQFTTDDVKYQDVGGFFVELDIQARLEAESFSLVNHRNGSVVSTSTDTLEYDIANPNFRDFTVQANMLPTSVGSVRFTLDGIPSLFDNRGPYWLNHWLLPDLTGEYHTITAQGFEGRNGDGYGGPVKRVVLRIVNSSSITDFDVVRSGTGTKLMDLYDGAVIDISKPKFRGINIVANETGGTVRSVKFVLNNVTARIDNKDPFALHGRANGTNSPWPATPGNYTLTAIPYAKYYGWGQAGEPLTIHFKVINGATDDPDSRVAAPPAIAAVEESLPGEEVFSVYPIPVREKLNIRVSEEIKGEVRLMIFNAQGKAVFATMDNADAFRNYSINIKELNSNQGIYFAWLQTQNGKRFVKKLLIEN